MNSELYALVAAVALGIFQLFLTTMVETKVRGTRWNTSSRDNPVEPLTGKAGRMKRVFENFKETFPFFGAAILLVTVSGNNGHISEISAWVYLMARVIYIPLYVFDIHGVRSLVWFISFLGIAGLLFQLFI